MDECNVRGGIMFLIYIANTIHLPKNVQYSFIAAIFADFGAIWSERE